jgi:hypothetical protein
VAELTQLKYLEENRKLKQLFADLSLKHKAIFCIQQPGHMAQQLRKGSHIRRLQL